MKRDYCKRCGQPIGYRTARRARQAFAQELARYAAAEVKVENETLLERDRALSLAGAELAAAVRLITAQLEGYCGYSNCEKRAADRAAQETGHGDQAL